MRSPRNFEEYQEALNRVEALKKKKEQLLSTPKNGDFDMSKVRQKKKKIDFDLTVAQKSLQEATEKMRREEYYGY